MFCSGGVLASPVLVFVVCFTSVIVSGIVLVYAGGILASPVRLFVVLFISVIVSGGPVSCWWHPCLA